MFFLFTAVPLTAFLVSIFGREEGSKSPWKELYTILIYPTSIPGIFAISLKAYLFLFERRPIMETNIFTQIAPILSTFVTLWLIRKNVRFDDIPCFDKLGGLMMILSAPILFMWIFEKTNILVITFILFHFFVLAFVILLILIRFGWKKLHTQKD